MVNWKNRSEICYIVTEAAEQFQNWFTLSMTHELPRDHEWRPEHYFCWRCTEVILWHGPEAKHYPMKIGVHDGDWQCALRDTFMLR